MAILLSQNTGQAFANASSVTTPTITTVGGSLLVIAACAYDGGGLAGVTMTPSDSQSNTWTLANSLIGDSTTLAGIWYNSSGSRGASHTFTFGLDTSVQMSCVGIEITGHNSSSILDQAASDSQTSGTATVTTSATTNAADLVLAIAITRGNFGTVNWAANGTITGSNGTDVYVDNDGSTHGAGSAVWYRIVAATGAQTAARSHDAVSSDWTIVTAAFKQAAAASPTALKMLLNHS